MYPQTTTTFDSGEPHASEDTLKTPRTSNCRAMSILANTVAEWSPIEASLLEWRRLCKQMRLLDSSRFVDADDTRMGQILWGLELNEGPAPRMLGICWEWREVIPNVVALSDPMGVQSNVLLNDERGAPVHRSALVLHLNAAVSRFRWQQDLVGRPLTYRHIAA